MAVWASLLRSNFRYPQVQRIILFLVVFFSGIPTFIMVVVTPHLSWGVWIDVYRGSKWIPEEIGFCWLKLQKQIQELLDSRWIFI